MRVLSNLFPGAEHFQLAGFELCILIDHRQEPPIMSESVSSIDCEVPSVSHILGDGSHREVVNHRRSGDPPALP